MSQQPSSKVTRKIVENNEEIVKELSNLFNKISNKAIQENGHFYLGLSGGSVADFASQSISSVETDFSKWKIFFCDERNVPIDDKDSTLKLYLDKLVGNSPLTKDQFIAVDTSLDVSSAAEDYEKKMRKEFPDCEWPSFDFLLLGMGPDGHTASLFPNHPLLDERKLWVAPISDSPKPPPERVTMTFPVINHSKACVFVIAGEAKATMLKRILIDHEDLPCTRVKPSEVFWIIDKAASSQL